MAKNMSMGSIIFLIGLVLAAIIALFSGSPVPIWAVIVLALLGIVVGFMNIQGHEIQLFLLAAIAFLVSFNSLSDVFTTLLAGWSAIGAFFQLLTAFIAPAAAIAAIKALFQIARD